MIGTYHYKCLLPNSEGIKCCFNSISDQTFFKLIYHFIHFIFLCLLFPGLEINYQIRKTITFKEPIWNGVNAVRQNNIKYILMFCTAWLNLAQDTQKYITYIASYTRTRQIKTSIIQYKIQCIRQYFFSRDLSLTRFERFDPWI